MALIALPSRGIQSIEWTQPPRAAWASKSAYSGRATIIDRGTVTQGWRATVTVAPRSAADVLAWRSWQAQMRGAVNETLLLAVESAQTLAAGPFPLASAPTANSFTASGLLPSQTPLLRAGSMVGFSTASGVGWRLAVLTSDLTTNGSGVSNAATFDPPLSLMPGVSTVALHLPFAIMRLTNGAALGWQVAPGRIYQPTSFDLEEIV
jgi:hypothetical protein